MHCVVMVKGGWRGHGGGGVGGGGGGVCVCERAGRKYFLIS